jgi:hypothetical protein
MTNNVLHMINLKLSSKRYLRRNRQSASQSTKKCVAIVKVRRNRQMRRKRQSASQSTPLRKMRGISYQLASQSTNASQTSKCVAIDNCRLAKRRICLNRHFFPNRRLCRNVYLHIAATPLQYFSVSDSSEKLYRISGG